MTRVPEQLLQPHATAPVLPPVPVTPAVTLVYPSGHKLDVECEYQVIAFVPRGAELVDGMLIHVDTDSGRAVLAVQVGTAS